MEIFGHRWVDSDKWLQTRLDLIHYKGKYEGLSEYLEQMHKWLREYKDENFEKDKLINTLQDQIELLEESIDELIKQRDEALQAFSDYVDFEVLYK